MKEKKQSIFDSAILARATRDAVVKLNPRTMARNPVMFVVEIGSVLTTAEFFRHLTTSTAQENVFVGMVSLVFFQRLIDGFPAAKQFGDLYAPLAGYIGLTVLNHLLIYTEGIPTSILNQGVVQWVKLRALEKIERIDYQAYIRASLISRRNRPFSTGRCART